MDRQYKEAEPTSRSTLGSGLVYRSASRTRAFAVATALLAFCEVSCGGATTDTTTKTAALTSNPIESISRVQGSAPVTIFQNTNTDGSVQDANTDGSVQDGNADASVQNANTDGSVQPASFTIGLFEEDNAQCQARHPPPSGEGDVCANVDDEQCGLFHCLIMGDLALNSWYASAPIGTPNGAAYAGLLSPYEDVTVVEVVVNVGATTTLHWEWTYEAWHNSVVSAFGLDLVAQDGSVFHIIKPITAPDSWVSGIVFLFFGGGPYGQYVNGSNSNDLELSRFWPNQKVRLRFSLRNSFLPSYYNLMYPDAPIFGDDWSGRSDLGMAKLIVNNLKINTDVCPISSIPWPLDPVAQQFEDASGPDTADLSPSPINPHGPDMKGALACLENVLGTDDSIVNSAYRPVSYQQHLYEVHQKWLELHNNTDPSCASLKEFIEGEEKKHGLVRSGAAKGKVGAHTKGLAVDLKNGDALVQAACNCGLYRPYAPALHYVNPLTHRPVIDVPHYQLKPQPGTQCF